MSFKRIYAIINLGVFFFIHLVLRFKRLFTGRPNGLQRFKRYYLKDRIVEFSPYERLGLLSFERCINCGMCSYNCELHKKLSRKAFLGMDILAFSQSKSTTESWTARELVDVLDKEILSESLKSCADCVGCANICPNEVSLTQVLNFVQAKLKGGLYG